MGAMQTAVEEMKNAPPAGKALILVSFLTVAGLGLWVAKSKGAGGTSATQQGSLLPIDLTGSTDGSVPFPDLPASGGTGSSPSPTPTPVSKPPTPTPAPKPKPPVGGVHVPKPPTPVRTVTVQKWVHGGYGEMSSLSAIAQKYYGNGALWTKIYNANKNQIKNPNLIYAGERLIVPY